MLCDLNIARDCKGPCWRAGNSALHFLALLKGAEIRSCCWHLQNKHCVQNPFILLVWKYKWLLILRGDYAHTADLFSSLPPSQWRKVPSWHQGKMPAVAAGRSQQPLPGPPNLLVMWQDHLMLKWDGTICSPSGCIITCNVQKVQCFLTKGISVRVFIFKPLWEEILLGLGKYVLCSRTKSWWPDNYHR